MKTVSILIKISYIFLTVLILGLTASLLSGGISILLPGLGLVISGNFILLMLIIVNISFLAFLMILKRRLEMK